MEYYLAMKKEWAAGTMTVPERGQNTKPQRLHTAWFYLHNILEMTELWQ